MRKPQRPKALLISLGVYLSFFAASVNAPEQRAQAMELYDEHQLYIYVLGRITHIGLGLDVLDPAGNPVGIRVWDFGSRNHYSRKNDEWLSGRRDWLGSLGNLGLLGGTTEGEMRAWDPTRRFGLSLEQFKRSSRIKVRLPITHAQWQALNAWLRAQAATFDNHDRYEPQGLDIWYGGGIAYNLFTFNCATFIGDALFAGGVFTVDNLPRRPAERGPVPSHWLFPPSVIAHYRTQAVLSRAQIQRRVQALRQRRACLSLQRRVPGAPLAGLTRPTCALG